MWDRTFKRTIITSAWKKTGLFPYSSIIVFTKLDTDFEETVLSTTPQRTVRTLPWASYSLFAPKPFQTTSTIEHRAAHRTYLNIRLIDCMNEFCPLTPSYHSALLKYQKAIELRLLKANVIKRWDETKAQHELEKVRRKIESEKHIQKNEVIYKKFALNQIVERTEGEQSYRESIKNAAVDRKVVATNSVRACSQCTWLKLQRLSVYKKVQLPIKVRVSLPTYAS
jgi:hypothetical protein